MTNLLVPVELLDKLHCSVCSLYLSIFPIYIRNNGNFPICGRCKVPNEIEFLRDEAFEGIAQFLIFPCSNAKTGCPEQLTPLKLIDHEKCCAFKIADCPSKNYSKCTWQGSNKDLPEHFKDIHPKLLLTDKIFAISFITSVKEIMLLQHEEELFIVKKEIDCRANIFICSVEHVIRQDNPEAYDYFLSLENHNQSCIYQCPQKRTDERTKLSADEIKAHLHDQTMIFARVTIVKRMLDRKRSNDVAEIKKPEVDWELLQELECPVCLEYMLPPIYQCIGGHSICSFCKPKVRGCPLCKGEIRNTQNFILERVTHRMLYPCKYHKSGCPVTLKSLEIKNHEDSCEYGPYQCPLKIPRNCNTKWNKCEMLGHLETYHEEDILKCEKIAVPFPGPNGKIETYYVLKFANKIFKICFKFENKQFYWASQLIGPSDHCKNFKFEIDIIDNSGNKLRQYSRGFCSPFGPHNQCFANKGNYVSFFYDQIANFITDTFSYRIKIIND